MKILNKHLIKIYSFTNSNNLQLQKYLDSYILVWQLLMTDSMSLSNNLSWGPLRMLMKRNNNMFTMRVSLMFISLPLNCLTVTEEITNTNGWSDTKIVSSSNWFDVVPHNVTLMLSPLQYKALKINTWIEITQN